MTTQNETRIQFYVRVESPGKLDKPSVKLIYRFLKTKLPSGILSSVPLESPGDGIVSVLLVARTLGSGKYEYDIPLTRNLTNLEFTRLKEQFSEEFIPELILHSSTVFIQQADQQPIGPSQIEPDHRTIMSNTLAQHRHNSWYNDRIANGWRFGTVHDEKAKTSPLLRSWHELPEKYKNIDDTAIEVLVSTLESLGYLIAPIDHLKELLSKK